MSFLKRYDSVFFIINAFYWLIIMHFTLPNLGGSGLYLPFNTMGWVYFSLIVGSLLLNAALLKKITLTPMFNSIFLGVAILCIPLLYPGFDLKWHSIPRMLGLVAGTVYLMSLYQWRSTTKSRDILLYIILGGVIIEAVLGLIQYYYLIPQLDLIKRPYGIFQQPNVMASFMATGLSIAVWLELRSQENSILRILRHFTIIISTVLLVALQSRVGQLGGIFALLLLLPNLYQQGRLKTILLLVFTGVAIGIISVFYIFNPTRGLDIYQSGGIRSIYWLYTLKLIFQSPLLGWGYGSFESTFLHKYMLDKYIHPTMPMIEKGLGHPHNEFLLWAFEGGVVAIIGMLVIILSIVIRLSSIRISNGMALFSLITPILLHTQTEYPLYHSVSHWWLLLILIYIVDMEVISIKRITLKVKELSIYNLNCYTPLMIKIVAVFIPLITIPFMTTTLHSSWVLVKFRASSYQDTSLLNEIVNPIALNTQVQFDCNTVKLIEALKSNDEAALLSYLEWGYDFLRHTPHEKVYANMIIASVALNDFEEAIRLKQEATLLFPNDSQFKK